MPKKSVIGIIIVLICLCTVYFVLGDSVLDKETIQFKRNCMKKYDYIDNIEIVLYEPGLEIALEVEDVSSEKVEEIISEIQNLVVTNKYMEKMGEKYRNKYKNIVAASSEPENYMPLLNLIIYDKSDYLIPKYTYIVQPPYTQWNESKSN